jgi:hypothetical protein
MRVAIFFFFEMPVITGDHPPEDIAFPVIECASSTSGTVRDRQTTRALDRALGFAEGDWPGDSRVSGRLYEVFTSFLQRAKIVRT